MKTFFFSDPHFGHFNIIEYGQRPFQTTNEMDTAMIANWNKTVSKNDHVFLLGDVTFHAKDKTREIFNQLNGKITLVHGNHDHKRTMEETGRFELVSPYPILFDNFFLLSHEPVFINEQCPFCNIHGHTHQNRFENTTLHINVSAECIDYTPIAFGTVRKIVIERLKKYNATRDQGVCE